MRLYKTAAKIRPSLLLAVLALPLAVKAQFSPNQSYGPGIQMDALSNITIGPSGLNATQLSYRFRATHTGNLQSVNPYLITDPNAGVSSGKAPCSYACGTGGTLVLQLETDDGSVSHLPSGTVLATASRAHPAQPPLTNPFPAFTFPVPGASLTSGTIYHLVWSNPPPNGSSNNFVSIDLAWIAALQNPAMRHEDFSVLELPPGSTTWFELSPGNNSSFTPIINMVYSSGTQGFAYYQDSDRHAIGSTGAVRESFTVTGASRTVVRISVRVRKLAEPTSELRIRFEDSGGNLIEDGFIPSSSFTLNQDTYVTYAFTSAHTLVSGQTYHVVLESDGSYDALAISSAAKNSWGFGPETSFADGHAEFKTGTSWLNWDSADDADLQMFFTLQ